MRLILLMIMLVAGGVSAEISLYGASVPVVSQSAGDRVNATAQALKQVLVRVSGQSDVTAPAEMSQSQGGAHKLLRQYRYVFDDEGGLQLSAQFEPELVNNLLRDTQTGVWPSNRPEVLLWVIQDTLETGRSVVVDPLSPLLKDALARAELRGLPTLIPLWDFDDQMALPIEQLWAMDTHAIIAASSRYDVDTVLVARYTKTSSETWFASWQFYHQGQVNSYEHTTSSIDVLGALSVDPLVDYLSSRYAVVPELGGVAQRLSLEGVSEFRDYRAALQYLNQQPLISALTLAGVERDTLLLNVELAGSWQQLNNALALDKKLAPLSAADTSWDLGSASNPARYQWLAR